MTAVDMDPTFVLSLSGVNTSILAGNDLFCLFESQHLVVFASELFVWMLAHLFHRNVSRFLVRIGSGFTSRPAPQIGRCDRAARESANALNTHVARLDSKACDGRNGICCSQLISRPDSHGITR